VDFERLHNFRDLGGHRTADGRTVAPRRLYRSDALSKLRGADLRRFRALGVRTVIDLRYPYEIAARGRVPEQVGLAYHNLSIEHRPYNQPALGPDVDPVDYLAERYAEVADDGVVELRRVIEVVAAVGAAPTVVHCASGKDRTGIVAALVLSLLGVAEDDIVADFAATGLATDRFVADWRAENPDVDALWPGYGQAPAELMRRFLAGLAATHGSVRGYAAARLGVDDDVVTALRHELLA
jgi:protein-tyrosine phosphatase